MYFMLQNKNGEQIIIEIFGLQKAGKTTLLRELKDDGKNVLDWEKVSLKRKFLLFFRHFLLNPLVTIYFLYKMNSNWLRMGHLELKDYFIIFKMRNSYFVSALAKYEYLKGLNGEVFVDEYLLQSLFMILQTKSSEEEIRKLINKLPLGNGIIIVEESRRKRYDRLDRVKNPATLLDQEFKRKWIENCEFNYEIIKKILMEIYKMESYIPNK